MLKVMEETAGNYFTTEIASYPLSGVQVVLGGVLREEVFSTFEIEGEAENFLPNPAGFIQGVLGDFLRVEADF